MTSSSEHAGTSHAPGVVRDAVVRPLPVPELRSGTWTRFGDAGVLGDPATERALAGLAESTRSAARAQGYAIGWSEGRREASTAQRRQAAEHEQARSAAASRREAEHTAAVSSLDAAASALQSAVAQTCARIEEQAASLALEVVRTLLDHELRLETSADVVARALAVLPEGPSVEVRLAAAHAAADAAELLRARGVRVVGDPTLEAGDALVVATDHVVDLRVRRATERLEASLAGGPEDAA